MEQSPHVKGEAKCLGYHFSFICDRADDIFAHSVSKSHIQKHFVDNVHAIHYVALPLSINTAM